MFWSSHCIKILKVCAETLWHCWLTKLVIVKSFNTDFLRKGKMLLINSAVKSTVLFSIFKENLKILALNKTIFRGIYLWIYCITVLRISAYWVLSWQELTIDRKNLKLLFKKQKIILHWKIKFYKNNTDYSYAVMIKFKHTNKEE